jgi:hypothetical protein
MWQTILSWLGGLSGVAVGSWASLPVPGQIALVLSIVIGLWKSSALQWLWNWVPSNLKPWVAPVLGVLYALFATTPFSWSGILQGLSGGMLAAALSQMMNLVGQLPVAGGIWGTIISFIESLLKAPQPPAA